MSVAEEQSDKRESIDPLNVRNELARYLTTAVNHALRQGLTPDEVRRTVEFAIFAREEGAKPVPVLPKPELFGKGINDMRERMAN